VSLKSLFLSSILFENLEARESFSIGDKIHVLSDKAFRKTQDNIFEAIGNVIITHKQDALYGEKASVSFDSGDVSVVGNVRFIGPEMTMYGSKLDYNFNTKILSVNNARILSDNYVVLGKNIKRLSNTEIVADNAEYTTCKDCPESWSIYGKKVRITVGEYIRIKHAFIKVRGVVVMYFPYIILPIKKKRETGLLFPSFGLNTEKGFRYQQPFFWAINNSSDMTFVPSIFGKRGMGSEYQFRQNFADKNWVEVNSLLLNDKVYVPGKEAYDESGSKAFRHLTDYEHHFYKDDLINHHFYYNSINDLDMSRDFESFSSSRVLGPEYGGGGFLDFTSNLFNLSLEGDFNRNVLYDNAKGFDHRYVQVLPEVKLSSTPFNIFQSQTLFARSLDFTLEGDYTIYRQNHVEEGAFIRNAHRVNAVPRLSWDFGNLGPIRLKTEAKLDFQSYRFPNEQVQKSLVKRGFVYETEASFSFQKIFGVSYQNLYPNERIEIIEENMDENDEDDKEDEDELLGDLKPFSSNVEANGVVIKKNSYKHLQEIKVKHFYLGSQSIKGSSKFQEQINVANGKKGLFDSQDVVRSQEFQLTNDESKTSLPVNNTVELQWNNSVIKKSSKSTNAYLNRKGLRGNFDYSTLSYFNVSQGYDFNVIQGNFKDHLTRLYLSSGVNLNSFSFSVDEYYYHTTQEHIFTFNLSKSFSRASLSSSIKYNSFKTPIEKFFLASGTFSLNDMISTRAEWEYDIDKKRSNKTLFGLNYAPVNNCWKVEFAYSNSIIESTFAFNFLINFNNNIFTSLSGLGGS
tara:strand:- start:33633 stop:36020 length:2388 start_codon:yes stop_codon:yes gene_type:complete